MQQHHNLQSPPPPPPPPPTTTGRNQHLTEVSRADGLLHEFRVTVDNVSIKPWNLNEVAFGGFTCTKQQLSCPQISFYVSRKPDLVWDASQGSETQSLKRWSLKIRLRTYVLNACRQQSQSRGNCGAFSKVLAEFAPRHSLSSYAEAIALYSGFEVMFWLWTPKPRGESRLFTNIRFTGSDPRESRCVGLWTRVVLNAACWCESVSLLLWPECAFITGNKSIFVSSKFWRERIHQTAKLVVLLLFLVWVWK